MFYPKLALLTCACLSAVVPLASAQNKVVALGRDVSYIGVNIQEVTADRAKALGLREEAGVEITRVEQGSPAEQAGIKAGDVVTQYNGQRVEGMEQFARMVRETPAGREARLTVVRTGSTQNITVKVGSRQAGLFDGGPVITAPFDGSRFKLQIPDVPRSRMTWRNSQLGIDAESVEGQLADFFGVKEGVLVRNVNSGSAAQKAGIRAGDIITRVGDSRVSSPSDLSSHLRSIRGTTATVILMRDHKETTVTVNLDDRASDRRASAEDRL